MPLILKLGDLNSPSHASGAPSPVPVVWDSRHLLNAHMVVCGKTGTGKSYSVKKMLTAGAYQARTNPDCPVRFHVLDVHADLTVANPELESRVIFSSQTQIGFNPLEINTHEHAGGVRVTINYFIGLLETVDRKLQVRQKNILRSLLEELYRNRGIIEEDQSTWVRRRITPELRLELINSGNRRKLSEYYPTLEDLIEFGQFKYNTVFGIGDAANENAKRTAASIKSLRVTFQKVRKLKQNLASKNSASQEVDLSSTLDQIETLKLDAKEAFSAFVDTMTSGNEAEDMVNFEHKDSFASILIRLRDLKGTGIFSGDIPRFDKDKPIWNYHIKHVPEAEKKLLIYYVLEKIFEARRAAGESPDLMEIIVVDEAHKFIEEDSSSVMNRIALEARKFGLGLWCSSQSPEHFSQDFITSVSTKILLGVDKGMWPKVSQTWDISKNELSLIVPKETCAIYMDRSSVANPSFKIMKVGQRLQSVRATN